MDIIDLEKVKNSDGWKYLSENCSRFEEEVNKFLNGAKPFVNTDAFNSWGILNNNEGEAINYETNYAGSKKVVLSYTSKPTNRDLDCQFKTFKKIEFSLDRDGNLVINELSGRLESKYGYSFEDGKDGVLKTSYSYQVFTKEGIELLYRGYNDKFILNHDEFIKYSNLRGWICEKFNPHLENYCDGKVETSGLYGKNANIIERERVIDNLGLVKVITAFFNQDGEPINKKEEMCFNTFIGFKEEIDPFLIHINRGIDPIAKINNGKLTVNYTESGTSENNYKEVARTRFGMELKKCINELSDEKKEGSTKKLLQKYKILYQAIGADKWIWKETSESKRSKR